MLQLHNLHAGYGELQVLKGINLHVHPGEIVALIGPNGAGKSTIINAIFNLAEVTHGSIFFRNKEITHLATHELVTLGIIYVNQGKTVFGNLTVYENLIIGVPEQEQDNITKNLARVYEKFPFLQHQSHQLAYELSGGQRQQLALGRALMQNPSLLLIDEPSLGLSPLLQKELFKTIAGFKKMGISALLVEQNAKKAIEIADKTYLLEDGQIVLEGRKEILSHQKIKEVYLGGRY
ncbi:ABC transporter ATP-binding protein [Candidatus Woesearchaeota archaeon]|nr:ABC transporter ATP-binding protein [Candidatus Woesearchaeota archaeon]